MICCLESDSTGSPASDPERRIAPFLPMPTPIARILHHSVSRKRLRDRSKRLTSRPDDQTANIKIWFGYFEAQLRYSVNLQGVSVLRLDDFLIGQNPIITKRIEK